jgi:hypothetical protein
VFYRKLQFTASKFGDILRAVIKGLCFKFQRYESTIFC